ncbi:hypothetical protein QUW50_02160 [Barnesiella viscericola]|uniref:hypothetical protein n=1 Tax=Barnesiella viscericola TaxID=397865 RepID=UPI0025A38F59|nr:hypothetical protein [Barnesiella viscericola]MDM8267836.1 hypothetical protein [Barnesiella viscericola]
MRLKDSILRMLLVSLTVVSLTSCSELMDDLFGGDDEPIQGNYTTALAGKWRVVKAGYVENPSGEMAYVGEELPCSIEWIEFSNGQAHFHFSSEVVLNRQSLGGSILPSEMITDYTCPCDLDGEGFIGFVFGFESEDGGAYHETYKEWVDITGDGEMFHYQANLWAYGKDENYATTLILYSDSYSSSSYGYEMERYDD